MNDLYRGKGLHIYEKAHYSRMEYINDVNQIMSWWQPHNMRVLDIGCSGGLHTVEMAKRDFEITGIDIEPSAIEIARRRCREANVRCEFFVRDIALDDITSLGRFGFVFSIGNVMSHIRKSLLPDVLKKVRRCINDGGTFLFEVFSTETPFQEEIVEKETNIVWQRSLNESTGAISMDGEFLDFGYMQHFDLWGYSIHEIMTLLDESGFTDIEYCNSLEFNDTSTKNQHCIFFRTKAKEVI